MRYVHEDGRERLRLRDEDEFGIPNLRLIVRDRDDGEAGAEVVVLASDRDWDAIRLDQWDIELVVAALRRAVVGSCPWCDPDGIVDGPDEPETCDHPPVWDASTAPGPNNRLVGPRAGAAGTPTP